MPKEERISKAQTVSQSRLLTQEEFMRLRTHQVLKEVEPLSKRKAVKRKISHAEETEEDNMGGYVLFSTQF